MLDRNRAFMCFEIMSLTSYLRNTWAELSLPRFSLGVLEQLADSDLTSMRDDLKVRVWGKIPSLAAHGHPSSRGSATQRVSDTPSDEPVETARQCKENSNCRNARLVDALLVRDFLIDEVKEGWFSREGLPTSIPSVTEIFSTKDEDSLIVLTTAMLDRINESSYVAYCEVGRQLQFIYPRG